MTTRKKVKLSELTLKEKVHLTYLIHRYIANKRGTKPDTRKAIYNTFKKDEAEWTEYLGGPIKAAGHQQADLKPTELKSYLHKINELVDSQIRVFKFLSKASFDFEKVLREKDWNTVRVLKNYASLYYYVSELTEMSFVDKKKLAPIVKKAVRLRTERLKENKAFVLSEIEEFEQQNPDWNVYDYKSYEQEFRYQNGTPEHDPMCYWRFTKNLTE